MSDLTNEQIQVILDGAPEGATHYDGCNYLRSEDRSFVFSDWDDEARIWCAYYEPSGKIQSLSDLREILALRQEVERLKAQQSEVAARAVDSVRKSVRNEDWEDDDLQVFLIDYANQLRKGEGDEQ